MRDSKVNEKKATKILLGEKCDMMRVRPKED